MFWEMEGNVASSSWLPVQKFRQLQNNVIWPLSPGNFWKDSCNSEPVFTWASGQSGTFFWKWFYLFSVFHACLGSTQPHTKCCSDARWCSGPTTRIVLWLHGKGGVAPSHKWKSGHGLSKGPLTTLISDFIILCINLLLFILPPAGVPDKNEHKKKQEYSILFMPAKDEHVVLFCALKSASNSHRP